MTIATLGRSSADHARNRRNGQKLQALQDRCRGGAPEMAMR